MTTGQENLVSLTDLLQKEFHNVRSQMKGFKNQLLLLVDDNRKLTNELKESIQYRISVTEMVDNITLLEQNLHTAVEAQNTEMKSPIIQEKKYETKFHDIRDEGVEKRILEVREHYRKGMDVFAEELHNTRDELKNSKQELRRTREEFGECSILLDKCSDMMAQNKKETGEFKKKEEELIERILFLESDLIDSRERLKMKIQEADELQNKNEELLSLNADFEKENAALNKSYSKAKKAARTTIATAEDAIFQKNELKLKEEYAQKHIQFLKGSMEKNIRNIVFQYQEDHQKAVDKLEKEKKALSGEIRVLYEDNVEKQNLLEKSLRENARCNSMLESLWNKNLEHCIPSQVYYELSNKLTECERARDDAVFQQTLLESKLKEVERMSSHEIEFYKAEAMSANGNLQTLTDSWDAIVPEREALAEEVEKGRIEYEALQQKMQVAEQLLQKEIKNYKEATSNKMQAFNTQLKTISENYMRRINELETILTTQQAVSQKWKNITLNINTPMEDILQH